MTDPHELSIRIQAANGVWETLGSDRYAGVVPESVQFTFNQWGPDTCSFVMRRNQHGQASYPDLTTWTPVEVEVAGRLSWDGRVKATPMGEGSDPQINVQCEGWQYHLDDDVYSAVYVHSGLTDAVDSRQIPTILLSQVVQLFNVQAGEGNILIGAPSGATPVAGTGGAVMFDLGYGCSASKFSIDVASSFNSSAWTLYVIGHDTPAWTDSIGRQDAISAQQSTASPFTTASRAVTITQTTSNPHRYWTILGWWTANLGALTSDIYFRVDGFRIYGQNSYESGGQSVLTADQVIKDALAHTAFLTDTSGVSVGTYTIRDFALAGAHSFREVISAANAYENYDCRVALGRRLLFAPRPTSPTYEIGEWSGSEFQDASAGSGDDIFNRVLVQGTGPDGSSLTVERVTPDPNPVLLPLVPNPSATVNASNWTLSGAAGPTFQRSTAQFNSSPASFQFFSSGFAPWTLRSDSVSQVFTSHSNYMLSIAIRAAILTSPFIVGVEVDGTLVASYKYLGADRGFFTATWETFTLTWTQRTNGSAYTVVFFNFDSTSTPSFFFDDVAVYQLLPTLVDKRKFTRTKILPIQAPITVSSGSRIGDLWLSVHRTQPLSGSLKVVGQGGCRRVVGGGVVHPAFIGNSPLIRLSHRIDPDTGGQGRDGRIAATNYNHDSLTNQVSIDEDRAGFDTLISRLYAVTNPNSAGVVSG